ncbi:MAG: Hsp20/alpha crystallin family protein [Alphaproteobacteria bacterium]|nr:Hsp20/alpha crystallin family protein [Alphaproteobacteria bacterium]
MPTSNPNAIIPSLQRSASNAFGPLQREFNRLFDELGSSWETFTEARLAPSMDVADTGEGFEVSVELPGMKREDVKISIDGDMLTVSGEKKAEKETKENNYRVVERTYGEFSRSIYLPRSVDASKITAVMSDGVLKITAPKRPEAQTKTIEIQAS